LFIEATPVTQEDTPVEKETTQPKKGLKLSYEDYKHLANLLVLYLRRQEEETFGKIFRISQHEARKGSF